MYSRYSYFVHGALATIWLAWMQLLVWLWTLVSGHDLQVQGKDMVGQIVIVTGANTGIGKMTSKKLASCGALVIMACRDDKRGLEAAAEINTYLKSISSSNPYAQHGKAQYMRLDLGDLASVLDFCRRFREKHKRLDVLVNNAGLNSDCILPSGLQQLFQVNYLGHYLLTRGLLDLLATASPSSPSSGRVVNLSSVMHHNGQPNYKLSAFSKYNLLMKLKYSYYSDSKFYMNLLTLQINQMASDLDRLRRSHAIAHLPTSVRPILALSANPGAVSSDIWRNVPLRPVFDYITSLVFLDTDCGSESSFFAATIDALQVRTYMQTHSWDRSVTGRMCWRGDLPYISPYAMPFPALTWELLGPYAGCRFSPTTIPARNSSSAQPASADEEVVFESPLDLAKGLWDFSAQTCAQLLRRSQGIADADLAFLSP